MKKLFITLLAFMSILAINTHSIAQEEIDIHQDAPQLDGPQIKFIKQVHDYGTVAYAGDGYCSFEFKNIGNAPLIISKANKSCGCTVPEWPKEPILPGETGMIKVKYDTKRPGAINKSVTIISNAINSPSKIIRIKGNVLPKPTSTAPISSAGPAN